ncbi:MAG TPA: hypothetical protein PKE30_02275 [Niabella sp.]|nr:hypothetical protein [Niabella sp.]
MNLLKYTSLLVLAVVFASCTKENIPGDNNEETAGLTLAVTIANTTHKIELYTESGTLQQGYNKVFFQIKNNDGSFIDNAIVSWKPIMNMTSMQHSCPYSFVTKTAGKRSLYEGFIVFQMAGNDTEYWELDFDYTIGGNTYSASGKINVTAPAKRNIVSFKGSDNINYIIALIAPTNPKVAVNDMQAIVFKMQDMMIFQTVDGYTIKIDPRMPGMGNHSSPNNTDLKQNSIDKIYHGKLSLTMTGYWKINLQLENQTGTLLKGEPVTTESESSSIYFEIEF